MIEANGLVKRYGSTTAVDDLSFSIRPGLVTGFLGPNGAGKTTTMRMILGLDAPTQGSVTVGGRSYRDLPIRIAELGNMYRFERSGVVGGLSRVRCMTLDDAHLFVRPDQVKTEIAGVLGRSEGAVRVLIHRALRSVARDLGEDAR